MMNCKDSVIAKLASFSRQDIFFSDHALIRLRQRQITKDEVISNLLNPSSLIFAGKQQADKPNEEKYNCFFKCSANRFHRYAIVIKNNVLVVTVIKLNLRWQKTAEKKLKNRRLH